MSELESQSHPEHDLPEGTQAPGPSSMGSDSMIGVESNTKQKMGSWWPGFIQILTKPHELDALRGANVYKIFVSGAVLNAIVYCISQWLRWSNQELREQALFCLNFIPKLAGAQLHAIENDFQFTQRLANSLIQTGFVGVAIIAIVFWLVHRVVSQQPIRMLAFVGMTSYSLSINMIGLILTTGLQLSMHNINASFSFWFLFPFQEHPFLNDLVSKFDVFLVWQYAAIGVAASSFQNRRPIVGLGYALGVLIFHFCFSATLTYMSYSILLPAK